MNLSKCRTYSGRGFASALGPAEMRLFQSTEMSVEVPEVTDSYSDIQVKTETLAEYSHSLPRKVKMFVAEGLSQFGRARVVVSAGGVVQPKARRSDIDQTLISFWTKMQPKVLPALYQ